MLILIDFISSAVYRIDRSRLKRDSSSRAGGTIETPFGPIVYRKLGAAEEDPILIFRRFHDDPRPQAYAARALGGTRVISIVRDDVGVERPSTPSNYIEFTSERPTTFFETIGTGYVQQDPPYCPELRQSLLAAGAGETGNLLVVDKPPAPDVRAWWQDHGVSLISVETQPEGALCRELELCYAVLALPQTARPDVLLPDILAHLPTERGCGCDQLMATARKFGKITADWFENLE
jgi:5'-methylthioadenosine phosphorylase